MAYSHKKLRIPGIKTVVVKVGSRILTCDKNLGRKGRILNIVRDIVGLKKEGVRLLLVSSGAIAHGVMALNLSRRPSGIPMQQACAGIGQIRLMHMYETLFCRYRVKIGQVLLTWDDLRDKKRYLNLRNTLFQLLDCGAVPIINENDSVGIEEIKFGDNDTLGAQIAMLVNADLFVNLTDINGLYDANPKKTDSARHIPLVKKITPAVHRLAGEVGTEYGVGGMATKLKAAEMVNRAGIYAIIGDGYHGRLRDVLSDEKMGTLFVPFERRMSAKHRWIAFSGRSHGALFVDDGAKDALLNKGKSLLPAGVAGISGTFEVGDMVDVKGVGEEPFARGMVNYSSGDILKIKGRKSGDIVRILGSKTFDEIIHRDNMVIV